MDEASEKPAITSDKVPVLVSSSLNLLASFPLVHHSWVSNECFTLKVRKASLHHRADR